MKTDTLLYALFQTAPSILFDLLGQPAALAEEYEFRAVEVKQVAFRIDGLFLPKPGALDQTVIFLENQFWDDPQFYHRFFAEIVNYLKQYPDTVDWKAVVIFSDRSVEPTNTHLFRIFLGSDQVQRIYLEDLQGIESDLLGIRLMQLIVAAPQSSIRLAKDLLDQTRPRVQAEPTLAPMLDLIETIIVYKFPNLSREAIEAMLGLSELKQTRVYRDALEEGREDGERSLILRQLQRRLGLLPSDVEAQVQGLALPQIEALGEALLDFSQLSELSAWLRSNG